VHNLTLTDKLEHNPIRLVQRIARDVTRELALPGRDTGDELLGTTGFFALDYTVSVL
jgi:hypothetical protein